MVLTIFQVAVNSVSADVAEEQAIDDPTLRDHHRLTISNYGASEPSFIISPNGTLYLAWIDLALDGVRLDYKHSFDNGTTFSPDISITPVFHSIDNISTAASDDSKVGISFEGRLTADSNRTVYVIFSDDGGISWSQAYRVCDGSSPSVALQNGNLYLGLIRPYGSASVFAVLEFELDGNKIVNGTSVMGMETGAGIGRIVADEHAIYYAIYCTSPYRAVVYGSIDSSGTPFDAVTVLASYSAGTIADLDIVLNDGTVFIAWTYNGEAGAMVSAAFSSDRVSWNSATISHTPGVYGGISAVSDGGGFLVAWENSTKAWTETTASTISSTGDIGGAVRLSTDRVEASSPSVAVDTNGETSAVWVEKHRQTTELFMFRDVLYGSPEIRELGYSGQAGTLTSLGAVAQEDSGSPQAAEQDVQYSS